MSDENETHITLGCADGHTRVTTERAIRWSKTITDLIVDVDTDTDQPIPLPEIDGETLNKIMVFFEQYVDADDAQDPKGPLTQWDKEFCQLENDKLFKVIMAANYLAIPRLMHLACTTVADMITGKTAAEIREVFNIKNDFTPEEMARIEQENEWCEER